MRIGVTGGIGAGKSLVCRIFNVLGVPSYDADTRAKQIVNNNDEVRNQIIDLLGPESFKPEYNTRYVAGRVFDQPEVLERLNAIIHPAVATDFQNWADEQDVPIVLKEAALLFEAGTYGELDATILVVAPDDVRISRVLSRDPHREKNQIKAIISRQLPDSKKQELADYVVINDGKQMVLPQVLGLLERIKKGH